LPEILEKSVVSDQLERMLESNVFSLSVRSRRFLRFIVEETLAGRAERLKGYAIGVEVFDREADFDPAIDAIVRVEAGRLRARLKEYYETLGREDTVVIELPKGLYIPNFHIDKRRKASQPRMVRRASDDRRPGIAVLPLVALRRDGENDLFADGLTDAVINQLARNQELSVTSFTSSMCFKGVVKSLPEIARELNVDYILEGTILRVGNRVRITAQLIHAGSDRHLWAESYERDVSDILVVQADVARQISTALGVSIGIPQSEPRAINVSAYEQNLLGRYFRSEYTDDSLLEAARHFEQAIAIDRDYAEAYAGLASCYCSLGSHGMEVQKPCEIIPGAMDTARHAIQLDEASVEGHCYLGIMLLKYDWNWPAAEIEFKRALELAPSSATTLEQYALYHESLAHFDKAAAYAERAWRVDPLEPSIAVNLAWQCHQAGDLSRARLIAARLREMEPDFWGGYWVSGHIERRAGDLDAAEAAFERAVELRGGNSLPYEGLGHVRARKGDSGGALAIIEQLDQIKQSIYVPPYRYAVIYAGLNDTDAMYARLEEAFEQRTRSLAWLKVAREFAPFSADARYRSLVKRIGIPDA
jgi:TolB-like protein/Tfp pilus assembly protein PilF